MGLDKEERAPEGRPGQGTPNLGTLSVVNRRTGGPKGKFREEDGDRTRDRDLADELQWTRRTHFMDKRSGIGRDDSLVECCPPDLRVSNFL